MKYSNAHYYNPNRFVVLEDLRTDCAEESDFEGLGMHFCDDVPDIRHTLGLDCSGPSHHDKHFENVTSRATLEV